MHQRLVHACQIVHHYFALQYNITNRLCYTLIYHLSLSLSVSHSITHHLPLPPIPSPTLLLSDTTLASA